ncbi:MAG: sulfite exporter TauE/SafE family protein, partial [Ferruginibacter sp.]
FLLPRIPDNLMTMASWVLTKDDALLLLFAVLMMMAAIRMIRPVQPGSTDSTQQPTTGIAWGLMLQGGGVGVLSGLVGAGGGFLMIPAMVLLAKIPMKKAVGTSLAVIAAHSLIGFTGDLQQPKAFDWLLLLVFTSLAILGIFMGMWLTRFFSGDRLKTGFGWFVLAMGIYILLSKGIGF